MKSKNTYRSIRKKLNIEKLLIFLYVAVSWSWLLQVQVGIITTQKWTGLFVLGFVFVVLVALSYWFARTVYTKVIKPRLAEPSWKNIVMVVALWAFFELLLTWGIAFLWIGDGGSWDNILPFTSLAPLAVATPLRFLARFVGYYGISAITGVGLLLLAKKYWRQAGYYWMIVIVVAVAGWMIYRVPTGETRQISIVSEALDFDVANRDIEQLTNATKGITDSRLIIVPEYGLDDYGSQTVAKRFAATDEPIYFSGTRQEATDQGIKNVLVYGNTQDGYTAEYPKDRLIPGGEYLAYPVELLLRKTNPVAYEEFRFSRAVVKGEQASRPFKVSKNLILGNAACSSIIHPGDYRQLTQKGSTVLANSASLEIFKGSSLFAFYHDNLARFMAVANARPFLQSANDWKAFALDHNGTTIASQERVGSQTLSVTSNSKKTPYTVLGEWVAYLGSGLSLVLVVRYVRKKQKLKNTD
ncbi:MAG: hypothetical protein U5L95_03035 [Candidatus Saccharibacteria bacterium]|nr:hypothetical protein [Candidatus Saccharibacteria bacterium]